MKNRRNRENIRRYNERLEERHRGVGASTMRMASQRVAETQIIHLNRLPCVVSDEPMQDADGDFLYRASYSDPNGPDVGAPGGGS